MKQWSMTFQPGPSVLAAVRQMVRDSLMLTDATYDVDVVVLLADELATNAVVHAQTSVHLTLSEQENLLHVEVQDEAPDTRPVSVTTSPGGLDEDGRGLALVRDLAHTWGVHDVVTGTATRAKVMWFDVLPVKRQPAIPDPRDSEHDAAAESENR